MKELTMEYHKFFLNMAASRLLHLISELLSSLVLRQMVWIQMRIWHSNHLLKIVLYVSYLVFNMSISLLALHMQYVLHHIHLDASLLTLVFVFCLRIGICYLSCVKSSLFDVILFLMIDLHVSFVFLVFCVTLFRLQVLHWSNHEKPKITNTNASSYQCIICSRQTLDIL